MECRILFSIKGIFRCLTIAERLVNATGNKYVIDKGNIAIADIDDLEKFYESIKKEPEYRQLSLF